MSDKKPATESGRQPADCEIRSFPFEVEDVRDAEGGRSKDFTIKGHAAVFNTWTDLGFFKERIAKGAFDNALADDPHVLHLIDHDTRYVLSSTRNKTLELRTDPKGLHMWSKVAPTTYAADLRVLMERGDVSQSSFAFTVKEDTWNETEDGKLERTINEVGQLFDVTTTAMGAYPTTDSQVASRTLAKVRSLAEEMPDSPPADEPPEDAAPEEEAVEDTEAPLEDEAADEASTTAPVEVVRDRAELFALKRRAHSRIDDAKALQSQLEKDLRWNSRFK